ncbi:DUF1120 domain-containing protein [Arthrobacter sp. NPDC080086]|uniref:DUF1120 domain-containing protein n=1 Tax=Arthrobacter sp. NPDC080086 TaxID=3155917 RepID=UPI00344C77DF
MTRNMITKVAALAVLGAAFTAPAFAQTSGTFNSTLTVTGVLTPGACNVSFTGGGAVAYGNLAGMDLKATEYLALTSRDQSLQVVCGANTPAYVSVIDNRSTSAIKDTAMKTALGSASMDDTQVFGLGTHSGTNIGAYVVRLGPASVVTTYGGSASVQPAVLSSTDKATWTASATPVAMAAGGTNFYSAGPTGASPTPVSARTFTFPLSVLAALNNTTNMPLDENIALDGSATFTVSYN